MKSKQNKPKDIEDLCFEDQIESMLDYIMHDESKVSDSEEEESFEIEKEEL
jgi:hypothetical protein